MNPESSSTTRLPNVLPRLLYAIPVVLTLALLACSGQLSIEVEKQATPTVEPTATPSPVPTRATAPTATATATAEPEEEPIPPLEIPDRGYNSVGSPDAPVTLLDFSDFT